MFLTKGQKIIFFVIILMIVLPTMFNAEPLYADLWSSIKNAATKLVNTVKDKESNQ